MKSFLSLALVALTVLAAGCAPKQRPNADPDKIAAVAYSKPGQPELILYTMINNRSGQGAHTSMLIGASQRVIFDPSGSFYSSAVPERNDVLFGANPGVEKAYFTSHARSTHHVVIQKIPVTAEQSEMIYQKALTAGPVAGGFCTNSTASILKSVPGFENLKVTFYPHKLSAQMEKWPGVVTERYYENDDGDLQKTLAENDARLRQQIE